VHRCDYLIEWRTAEACPKSAADDDGSSGSSSNVGLIVFLVILSLILVYFIGGFCYNRFVLGAKGVDQIPHYHVCEACYYSCLSCLVRRGRAATGHWAEAPANARGTRAGGGGARGPAEPRPVQRRRGCDSAVTWCGCIPIFFSSLFTCSSQVVYTV